MHGEKIEEIVPVGCCTSSKWIAEFNLPLKCQQLKTRITLLLDSRNIKKGYQCSSQRNYDVVDVWLSHHSFIISIGALFSWWENKITKTNWSGCILMHMPWYKFNFCFNLQISHWFDCALIFLWYFLMNTKRVRKQCHCKK